MREHPWATAQAGAGDDARPKGPWRTGRGSASLKLVRAIRGKGALVWAGGEAAATYEIDVFARGAMHTVNGRVQGAFSALAGGRTGVRLRLNDGREIAVDLTSLTRSSAEFEAESAAAVLLS